MQSSSGHYYLGLDHVRALAIFLVFCWHFIHAGAGHVAPPPVFPLSFLAEGHTGVAIFMTLSGYLMAKLINARRIHVGAFLRNRLLRLLPMLLVVFSIAAVLQDDLGAYALVLLKGLLLPVWPNGGWSIAVELHFYLLLPLLLWLVRRNPAWLLGVLLFALAVRGAFYADAGQVQSLAYWTLGGRIDQFVLGMLAYHYRHFVMGRAKLAALIALAFAAFMSWFDALGGFYTMPSYPSPSPIWLVMSLVEGACYASLIAWYDDASKRFTGPVSQFVARIGQYSYSIYLLHFFVVFAVSDWLHTQVVSLSNIYVALALAVPSFLLMLPLGYLSYRFIEAPCLRYRRRYILA